MAIVFSRALVIPVWAIAFCVVALIAPPHLTPSVTALLGIAVIALTMTAMFGWWRARTLDEAIDVRALKTDALDLVRMDDDGAWQAPRRTRGSDGSRD
jgi:Na+-transporting NADH:ubiquinone oxidoreductase subunit NqrB